MSAAGPSEAPAPPTPEPPPREAPSTASALDRAIDAYEANGRLADESAAVGNMGASQRARRDQLEALKLIRQLRKMELADETDVIRVTAREMQQADRELDDLLTKLTQWPLTCPECGKRLRVQAAGGTLDDLARRE